MSRLIGNYCMYMQYLLVGILERQVSIKLILCACKLLINTIRTCVSTYVPNYLNVKQFNLS